MVRCVSTSSNICEHSDVAFCSQKKKMLLSISIGKMVDDQGTVASQELDVLIS